MSAGESFRSRSLAERLAAALPSSGGLAPVRRWLKPVFASWLAPVGSGLRSVLPLDEEILVSPQFRHMTWNREEYAAFRAAVRPGDIVLEAGANVGAYTMLFAQWVGPAGRVFAFEPDPEAYAGLQAHIALNGLADRVTAVASAVTDGSTSRAWFEVGQSSGVSRIVQGSRTSASQEVETISIDRFCADRGIAPRVIKIDIEGAELAALRGARSTIAAAGAGLELFVEMHPHLWGELGLTSAEIGAEFAAQGLTVQSLDGSAGDIRQIEGVCLRLAATRA